MSIPTKTGGLHAHQLFLYRRALHPELFRLKGRRRLTHNGSELEAWIMPGAHALRFQAGSACACELVVDRPRGGAAPGGIPAEGAVASFPCAGEHDFEFVFEESGIKYVASVQTENLAENLYEATYAEMVEFARETESMSHAWADADGGRCLSVLEVERHLGEMHAHGYHLLTAGGLVVRTQSIFEVAG